METKQKEYWVNGGIFIVVAMVGVLGGLPISWVCLGLFLAFDAAIIYYLASLGEPPRGTRFRSPTLAYR